MRRAHNKRLEVRYRLECSETGIQGYTQNSWGWKRPLEKIHFKPLPRQGHLEQVTPEHVHTVLAGLRRGRGGRSLGGLY